MSVVGDALLELLFGEGSWLGLVLMMTIIMGFTLKWKLAGVLMIPVTVFMGLDYLGHDLTWHSIIMLCATVFLLYVVGKEIGKGKGR